MGRPPRGTGEGPGHRDPDEASLLTASTLEVVT